jgi:hypothetical protein
MLRDARIRLEGRLEELEAAIVALETGLRFAKRGQFTLLREAMNRDTREARAQIAKLDEPELKAVQRKWARLHARAAAVITRRARIMRVPELPLEGALDALATEPVAYEESVRTPTWAWSLTGIVGTLLVFFQMFRHSYFPPMFGAVALALVLLGDALGAVRFILTDQRLLIGPHQAALKDVHSVLFERVGRRKARVFVVIVQLRTGARFTQQVPRVPLDFIQAARAAGLEVHRNVA